MEVGYSSHPLILSNFGVSFRPGPNWLSHVNMEQAYPPADSIAGPDAPIEKWERPLLFQSHLVPDRWGQVSNLPFLAHHLPLRSCYRDCLDNPNPNLKEWSD